MPDLDDLLQDDEEDTQPEPRSKDNAAFAQMRKEKKQLEKEVEELRAFRVEAEKAQRGATLSEVATQIGLNPKHAKFYPTDAETTAEALKAWAVAEDFIQVEEGEQEAPAPREGFTPTVVSEGQPISSKTYSYEDWRKLLASDQDKAMQLWNSGRVQPEVAPWAT